MRSSTIRISNALLRYITFAFTLFFTASSWSQMKAQEGMFTSEYNFESFVQLNENRHPLWTKLNSPKYYKHPEFGKLPQNAPCTECVEIYEKRSFDGRYFVSTKDTTEFFVQQALGQLHQKKGVYWETIDHQIREIGNGSYLAPQQLDPVGFDTRAKKSFIQTPSGQIDFNNWTLVGVRNGEEVVLAIADWTNYSAGSDGIRVKSIFPGIDAEMSVLRGAVKTNFIVKQHHFKGYDKLLFVDEFSGSDARLTFENFSGEKQAADRVLVQNNIGTILEIGTAIIYPKDADKSELVQVPYELRGNKLVISVSDEWMSKKLAQYGEVIIDPLVSSSNTLAQASITGSMYNAACNFTNSCNYNLTVPTPANAQLTDVLWTFSYTAAGICWLEDGAVRFTTGACVSPSQAGFYWFCNQIGTGTCNGVNISCFPDLQSCLPAPSCTPQNVDFTMQFFRSCYGATGCNSSCIGAATPWTMTIQGQTIDYQTPVNPITISSTSVCAGGTLNASTLAQYGVPPYNYNWSMSPSGTPSVGSTAASTITFNGTGVQTLYSIVTDACGNQVSNSVNVTVNPAEDADFQYSPSTICTSSANPVPVITNAPLAGTFSAPGVTFANTATGEINLAATPAGTYTVTFTSSGACPDSHQQSITITGSPDATFSYNSPFCQSAANPLPQLAPGAANGTYTASSGNLSINATTGQVDLQNSLPGTYNVTNTIPAVGGCPAANHVSQIVINPSPNATLSGGGTVCQGSPLPNLTITLTGTGPWNVDITDGTATQNLVINSSPHTFTPSSTGTYQIQAVSDQNCSGTFSGTIAVTESPAPTVNAVAPIAVCAGELVDVPNFTGSVGGTTYAWTNSNTGIGLGASGNGNIADFTSINAGSTPVVSTVQVTPQANGCSGSPINFTITVNPAPTPQVNGTTTYCFGDAMSDLIASASAGGQLNWYDDPSLTTSLGTGTNLTPSSAVGSHTYYVTEDFSGCTSSPVQITVTVNALPNVSAGIDQSVCEGSAVVLSGSGANSYTWDNGVQDGVAFNPANGTVNYTVSGTDLNGCTNTDQVSVNVEANPTAFFTATPNSGQAPLDVTFTNNSNGGVNYVWDFGNGSGSNTPDINQYSTYSAPGVYTVTLLATSANGCSDLYSAQIIVDLNAPLTYDIPNVFTPDGDGVNDIFHFNLQNAESFEATILNRWGNVVANLKGVLPTDGWTGSDHNTGEMCSEGVYFCHYKITDLNGEEFSGQTFVYVVFD